jgi:hypothetical protein
MHSLQDQDGETTVNASTKKLSSCLGWSNYFGYGSRGEAYRSVDQYVFEQVRRFLARRHPGRCRGFFAYWILLSAPSLV